MFKKLLEKIGAIPITFQSWLLSALGIIFIRIFLEQYSHNIPEHFVLIDLSTIVQYTASFLAVLLWCTAIILIFTKKSLREASIIALFGFMIIWLAPTADLIISGGEGYGIYYLFLPAKELFLAFITGFWSTSSDGMTYGIRLEIIAVFIASFSFVHIYTKNILKSFLAAVSMWFGIFFVCSLPSILGLFQDSSIPHFIQNSIFNSNIINNSTFTAHFSLQRLFEIGFNSLMIQANLIVAFIATAIICLFGYKEKAIILLKNARPERILHYTILIIIGSLFAGNMKFLDSWVNVLSLIMAMIAFAFAWMAAVCINDIHDEKIDEISNKNRPIPSGKFTREEFYTIGKIFLLISLVTAYSASWYCLFFVVLFSLAYHIYSVGPLKLKRHYLGGIFVIGINSVSALLTGFFLANKSKELFSISPLLVLILGLIFGLSSIIKDLKDYDGDKANGIKTLPVVIGLLKTKIIVGIIFTLSIMGFSIYLKETALIVAGSIASILVWRVLLAKVYKERDFFIVYIAFLVICAIVFLLDK